MEFKQLKFGILRNTFGTCEIKNGIQCEINSNKYTNNLFITSKEFPEDLLEMYQDCYNKCCEHCENNPELLNDCNSKIYMKLNRSVEEKVRESKKNLKEKYRITGTVSIFSNIYNNRMTLSCVVQDISFHQVLEPQNVPLHFLEMLNDKSRVCPVCMEDIQQDAYLTSCCHLFHYNCVKSWIEEHHSCPTCRNSLVKN